MRLLILLSVLVMMGCEDSIQPTSVEPREKQAFEKNATDAVGVAEGDKQVSPYGRPAY